MADLLHGLADALIEHAVGSGAETNGEAWAGRFGPRPIDNATAITMSPTSISTPAMIAAASAASN